MAEKSIGSGGSNELELCLPSIDSPRAFIIVMSHDRPKSPMFDLLLSMNRRQSFASSGGFPSKNFSIWSAVAGSDLSDASLKL